MHSTHRPAKKRSLKSVWTHGRPLSLRVKRYTAKPYVPRRIRIKSSPRRRTR